MFRVVSGVCEASVCFAVVQGHLLGVNISKYLVGATRNAFTCNASTVFNNFAASGVNRTSVISRNCTSIGTTRVMPVRSMASLPSRAKFIDITSWVLINKFSLNTTSSCTTHPAGTLTNHLRDKRCRRTGNCHNNPTESTTPMPPTTYRSDANISGVMQTTTAITPQPSTSGITMWAGTRNK